MVHLQVPFTFQSLIFLSQPPDKIILQSGEKQHEKTSLVCPKNLWATLPCLNSHNLMVLSHEADKAHRLSLERAKSLMKWSCPKSYLCGYPKSWSSDLASRFRLHTIILLSLEAEINILVSSSSFLAFPDTILVTHPLWP